MSELILGMQKEPETIVAYGVPGVGKSHFAKGSPSPLFIGPERNGSLDVAKLKRTTSHDHLCSQMNSIINGVYDKHNFRTIVLDSIDMHEKDIHREIEKREKGKSMATAMGGYGKAYSFAGSKLYEIRDLLDEIRNKKEMNVIVLGHCNITSFSDPMLNTEYDVYEMALHKTKRQDYNSVFMDWANCVFFLNWKYYRNESGIGATSLGKREILTEFRPSHFAKNRYNLPYSIELTLDAYQRIDAMIEEFYRSGSKSDGKSEFENVARECMGLMGEVKDQTVKPKIIQAIESISGTKDINNILAIRTRIQEIVANQ